MGFSVVLARAAKRRLRRLSRQDQRRVSERIDQLAVDPRGGDAKLLKGKPIRWSTRVGNHRIVCRIDESANEIRVTDIDLRDRVYRRIR